MSSSSIVHEMFIESPNVFIDRFDRGMRRRGRLAGVVFMILVAALNPFKEEEEEGTS